MAKVGHHNNYVYKCCPGEMNVAKQMHARGHTHTQTHTHTHTHANFDLSNYVLCSYRLWIHVGD